MGLEAITDHIMEQAQQQADAIVAAARTAADARRTAAESDLAAWKKQAGERAATEGAYLREMSEATARLEARDARTAAQRTLIAECRVALAARLLDAGLIDDAAGFLESRGRELEPRLARMLFKDGA